MASDTPAPEPTADDSRTGRRTPGGAATGDEPAKKPPRMGRYELVKHIATGGMGRVYRARDTQEGREVALKILVAEAAKPALLERFRREARSAAKMKHENIVTVYEFGEVSGNYFLAMEFIDGIDLHDYVKRKGPLDPEEARQIVLQAARALQHAGDHNIIHRDIKPSNFLLLRRHGRPLVKLTDFGLAREVTADEYRVTRAGTTVGTIDYMSPEQARDSSAADTRSDLYSLGCTWFHLLTGQAPFPEGGLGERLIKIMSEQPPDVRELNPRASDETWAVLSKLLEKDPDDRFQTPEELIEALIALEGSAVARSPSKQPVRKKTARKPRPDETDDAAPATLADGKGSKLPYIVGGAAALLAAVAVVAALAWPTKPPKKDPDPVVVKPPDDPIQPGDRDRDRDKGQGKDKVIPPPPDRGKDRGKDGPKKDGDKGKPPDKDPPVKSRFPALYRASEKVDVKALRQEIDRAFADNVLHTAEPFTAKVSRLGTYRSLSDAVAAAPAGRAIVIEIHDNGPLFEQPVRVEGRRLSVKAGKGYRPLIVWDLPATLDRRRREKKSDEPLVFLNVKKGSLALQGLELALRWPEGLAEAAAVADVADGDVSLTDCTVSAAGKPAQPVTLARVRGGAEPPRCRFTRLHARGGALAALDLDADGSAALFDGCLVVGGQSLIRLRGQTAKGPKLYLARSTLLASGSLVELRPAVENEHSPALEVLAWDCLLARAGGDDSELLTLRDRTDTRSVRWRGVNSLYVGFKNLLGGATTVAGTDARGWRQHWKRAEGDEAVNAAWPEQPAGELATQPAAAYEPTKPVAFASTVDPERPLGCDLAALPPSRDGWVALAFDPTLALIDLPSDSVAPEIPSPNDGLYHGERIDLGKVDLGEYLARQLRAKKPGPKVVLHLRGKGDSGSSPIRLNGSSLVLFFEPPADEKAAPPALKLTSTDGTKSLVEIDGGGLEVINGSLKLLEVPGTRGAHLIRVRGGDVKLYRTRLEGPQVVVPAAWQAALAMAGSGDAAADKARVCALNECVVVSGKAGVVLDGVGVRLAVRQSLIVSGSDAVVINPAVGYKGKASVQAAVTQTTLAARGAIVRLGDAPGEGVPAEPALIQTRDCAFLNPFPGSRGGLLLAEGGALARGLLVWQSERDAIDQRLFYAAKTPEGALPERREGLAAWQRLWGSAGVRSPRAELGFLSSFDAKRWALERLALRVKDAPGADLEKLGVRRPK